jgi:hypothetical protein
MADGVQFDTTLDDLHQPDTSIAAKTGHAHPDAHTTDRRTRDHQLLPARAETEPVIAVRSGLTLR